MNFSVITFWIVIDFVLCSTKMLMFHMLMFHISYTHTFFYINHRKFKGERHEALYAKKPTATNTSYVKDRQYVEFKKKSYLEA